MEEYHRRESAYDLAIRAYQNRVADMLRDTRFEELENSNARYRQQLELAEARILSLENNLRETSLALEIARGSASAERLRILQSAAHELENFIQRDDR
jgi:lipid II:glycine glycyltransferase (peptidoglycan interpeptide bridge formation enzyme)